MEDLESKLRRSSCFFEDQIFRQFLSYASMVSDPEEVYTYMEQNKIGIDQPEFWNAKLHLYKEKAEYTQFVALMKKIQANRALLRHPKYWLIKQTENQLEKSLQKKLRKKARHRRSAKQYEVLNFSNVQKETRKFGQLQVYVDPDCRMAYRLEDLALFVHQRLKDQCQFKRNCYLREKQEKPLSFLGRKDQYFKKMSQQFLVSTHRNSINQGQSNRKSLKPRNSIVCKTPQFKKSMSRKKSLRRQSSVQILKKIDKRGRSILVTDIIDPEQDSLNKQIARMSGKKKKQEFSLYDLDISGFSFKGSKKQSDISSETESQSPNNAFFQSSQEDSRPQDSNELQKVIKQIQLQRNQSQTISEIDSNKQNAIQIYESYAPHERKKIRHLFETIQKQKSQELSQNGQNDDSEELLYQQFLETMPSEVKDFQQRNNERRKQGLLMQPSYVSDRKTNRISRISEERSYSYSETRQKSGSHERY